MWRRSAYCPTSRASKPSPSGSCRALSGCISAMVPRTRRQSLRIDRLGAAIRSAPVSSRPQARPARPAKSLGAPLTPPSSLHRLRAREPVTQRARRRLLEPRVEEAAASWYPTLEARRSLQRSEPGLVHAHNPPAPHTPDCRHPLTPLFVSTPSAHPTFTSTPSSHPTFVSLLPPHFCVQPFAGTPIEEVGARHTCLLTYLLTYVGTPIEEVSAAYSEAYERSDSGDAEAVAERPPLFLQLYPPRTPTGSLDRAYTLTALRHAEGNGCRAVFVTVDTQVDGNRERTYKSAEWLNALGRQLGSMPAVVTLREAGLPRHPGMCTCMSWSDVSWIRSVTDMKVRPPAATILTRHRCSICTLAYTTCEHSYRPDTHAHGMRMACTGGGQGNHDC